MVVEVPKGGGLYLTAPWRWAVTMVQRLALSTVLHQRGQSAQRELKPVLWYQ